MRILIVCFLGIVLCGCKEGEVQITNVQTEYVDFFSLLQKDIDDIPDSCISQVRYIRIAPASNLLFGEIHKIEIVDDKIYLIDRYERMFGVFDMSGNGLGRVGDVGRAPEEYLNITDFGIDRHGNIHLIDGRLDKKNVYDSHFNFVASERLPFEVDILQCLDDGGFLLGLSSWNKDLNAGDKIIKVDSALNPVKSFCEYEKGIDPNYWVSFYHFLHYDDYIIYNRFLDNHVYLFSESGEPLKSVYFDFGKKNVPEVALKRIEQKEEMFDRLCCLQNFTIVDENYLLGYVWDERSDKIFLIDRTKNVLYLGKPDPFNKLGHVIGVCTKGIISCIYPGEYLEYKEQGKTVHLPKEAEQHLNNEGVVLCLYLINIE